MGGGQPVDLVLRGGHAYLVDAARSWAQAVAVAGGRIAGVGTDAEVSALAGPHTEVIDLAGRMLLPGFTDSHVHTSSGGLERIRCDLTGAHRLDDYLAAVRRYAEDHPAAAWITGGGWSLDVFPGGVPSKEDLDRAAPGRPVFLSNRDHHAVWVNSRALALAGIDASTPDPADGRIERDARGEPSGVLQEGAMNLVERVVPGPDLDEQVAGIGEGQRYLHALGVTSWQEAIVGDYAVTPDCFDAYLEAERRGLLTSRVVGALWWQRGAGTGQLDGLAERRDRAARAARHGGQTAGAGASFFDPQELNAAVTAIDARGFQVHFHAIGDRAVREALDAVEAARAANGPGRGRHHISHLQVVHP